MYILRLEINGGPATVEQLAYPALVNYGHFTAMQGREGAVRGLGITMQLVSTALAERGVPSRRETVRTARLPSFRSAFVTNSLGVAPVGQVDDQILAADPGFTAEVVDAHESVPWDRI